MKQIEAKKVYLGDSVYAQWDGWQLILTTENGYEPSNTIALEGDVYINLVAYVESVLKDPKIL